MAKQSGIHQLKGKVRGMSYYRQKGVSDGLARSINQGLSARVKNDAAYLNTRLNGAEFGFAGSFAGACIRNISDRQRAMLKDFATGMLAKQVREIIVSDTTNPWGQRHLVGTDWQELLMQIISSYAKVDFASNVGGVFDVSVASSGGGFDWTPDAELPTGWGSLLGAKGATGAYVDMYAYKVQLTDLGAGVRKADAKVAIIGSDEFAIGTAGTITAPATLGAEFDGTQADDVLQGVLVVVRPYQEVNSVKYIRQELCTFEIIPTV